MVCLGLTMKALLTFFSFASGELRAESNPAAEGNAKWLDNYVTVIILDYDDTMVLTKVGRPTEEGVKRTFYDTSMEDRLQQLLQRFDNMEDRPHILMITDAYHGWVIDTHKLFLPHSTVKLRQNPEEVESLTLGGVEVRVISSREKKYELPEDAPYTEPNRRYKQNSKLMPFEKTIKDIFKNLDDENVNKVEEEKKKLHLIVLGDGDKERDAAILTAGRRSGAFVKIIRFKKEPTIEQWSKEYEELLSGNYLEQMYLKQDTLLIQMDRESDKKSFEDQITGKEREKESKSEKSAASKNKDSNGFKSVAFLPSIAKHLHKITLTRKKNLS